jgi:hypothetical protein
MAVWRGDRHPAVDMPPGTLAGRSGRLICRTADPNRIIAAVKRGHQALDSIL